MASLQRVLRPGGAVLLKVMHGDERRFVSVDRVGGRDVQMPFHFTAAQLRTLLAPHFTIEVLRDSVFHSSVIDVPARAFFLVLRHGG